MEGDVTNDVLTFAPFSYFNPLPPHGGRQAGQGKNCLQYYFNPLPPHGGRLTRCLCFSAVNFISIHSLRMEGDDNVSDRLTSSGISIHSLRMEGDLVLFHFLYLAFSFQSTPSAWRETEITEIREKLEIFQSTPSAWRETTPIADNTSITSDFNPLPPHGGRPMDLTNAATYVIISIHSLRMEGDTFQHPKKSSESISIHSLRMEGDQHSHLIHLLSEYFNPLPPHGGRRVGNNLNQIAHALFQSTPSAWRETKGEELYCI